MASKENLHPISTLAHQKMPRLIGLCGHQGAGKNTFADFLYVSYGYKILAFSDAIYQILWDLNPKIGGIALQGLVLLHGWDTVKRNYQEVRQLLQLLGESARKNLGEDVWVNSTMAKVQEARGLPVVIHGVRHTNEVDAIRDHNGILIHVTRPGCTKQGNHASEQLDYDAVCDYYVENNFDSVREFHAYLAQQLTFVITGDR